MIHERVVGICRGGFALGSGNKHGLRVGRHDRWWSEASGDARLCKVLRWQTAQWRLEAESVLLGHEAVVELGVCM